MEGKIRRGAVVRCISDKHQHNVPVGTVGVVVKKNYIHDNSYKIFWFAYPTACEDPVLAGVRYTDYYKDEELEEI